MCVLLCRRRYLKNGTEKNEDLTLSLNTGSKDGGITTLPVPVASLSHQHKGGRQFVEDRLTKRYTRF